MRTGAREVGGRWTPGRVLRRGFGAVFVERPGDIITPTSFTSRPLDCAPITTGEVQLDPVVWFGLHNRLLVDPLGHLLPLQRPITRETAGLQAYMNSE